MDSYPRHHAQLQAHPFSLQLAKEKTTPCAALFILFIHALFIIIFAFLGVICILVFSHHFPSTAPLALYGTEIVVVLRSHRTLTLKQLIYISCVI